MLRVAGTFHGFDRVEPSDTESMEGDAMAIRALLTMIFLLALTACSGGATGADDATHAMPDEPAAAPVEDDQVEGEMSATTGLAGGGSDATGDDESVAEEPAPLPDPLPARPGDRIIKEGTISLEVEQEQFDRAFLQVVSVARRYGGDVVGSSTRTADDGATFGSITLRVPVANFEDLLIGVGDIGQVRSRDIGAEDVSTEFTDLESRLRHLEAQERFYLGLLEDADGVRDAIAVQQRLDGIQEQIEQIKGRLRFLDDRTSFSTLTVELFEPGAGATLLDTDEPTDRPSLARYWDTARDAFVNVIGAMLVALLFLAPLLVPAVVLLALWRWNRRQASPSRTAPPAPPEPTADEREPVEAGH